MFFFRFFDNFVTWHLTLETLITLLTIEKNKINNYFVTFEQRVTGTASASLAMFNFKIVPTLGWNVTYCKCENVKVSKYNKVFHSGDWAAVTSSKYAISMIWIGNQCMDWAIHRILTTSIFTLQHSWRIYFFVLEAKKWVYPLIVIFCPVSA